MMQCGLIWWYPVVLGTDSEGHHKSLWVGILRYPRSLVDSLVPSRFEDNYRGMIGQHQAIPRPC